MCTCYSTTIILYCCFTYSDQNVLLVKRKDDDCEECAASPTALLIGGCPHESEGPSAAPVTGTPTQRLRDNRKNKDKKRGQGSPRARQRLDTGIYHPSPRMKNRENHMRPDVSSKSFDELDSKEYSR